jgi:hypothetical protein
MRAVLILWTLFFAFSTMAALGDMRTTEFEASRRGLDSTGFGRHHEECAKKL